MGRLLDLSKNNDNIDDYVKAYIFDDADTIFTSKDNITTTFTTANNWDLLPVGLLMMLLLLLPLLLLQNQNDFNFCFIQNHHKLHLRRKCNMIEIIKPGWYRR